MCSQDLLRMCSDTNVTPVLPGIDPPNHEPWGSDSGVAGIHTQWCLVEPINFHSSKDVTISATNHHWPFYVAFYVVSYFLTPQADV